MDPADTQYEQYGDRADNPERRPGEYLPLLHVAYFLEYRITTLNLPGPYPRMQGEAPFRDPYGYRWEHLDEWGRLGKFEWTARTQYMPPGHPFPIHRAFIPLEVTTFDFDPRVHLVKARGPDPGLRSLSYTFLDNAKYAGIILLKSMYKIDRMTSRYGLTLPSNYDPDWHFGASWMQLLRQGMTPSPAWKIAHTAEEIRRRLLDGTGFVTMAFRILLYLWCYKECLAPPKFRTTTRLTGVIINRDDPYSDMVAQGLAELGVPAWGLRVTNNPPPMELYPRGTTRHSSLWTESEEEIRRKYPYVERRGQQETRFIRESFESKVREQLDKRLATGPENIWVMIKDHPGGAAAPGLRFRHHEAYYRRPKGPEHEYYLEGLIRWLTGVQEGNYMSILLELQEVLGKNTLSLNKLARGEGSPPLLPLLYENYPACRRWSEDSGRPWQEPPPVPQPPVLGSLQARLIDPNSRTYGAAPALYERIGGLEPLYPSAPLSTRLQDPEPPRHEQPRPGDDGSSLEPYEALEPNGSFEPPTDFTLPDGAAGENLAEKPSSPMEEEPAEDVWAAPGARSDRFPVELAPFVYLGSLERLEDELMDRYGSGVKEWLYEEPRLVLVFAERDRAARAIKNQGLAAGSYPSESPARAIAYTEGTFQSWSPNAQIRAIAGVTSRRRDRLTKCPVPEPIRVRGGMTRPPGTVFKSQTLVQLLHPGGLPSTVGSPLTLMSRYFVPPIVLLFFLDQRIAKLMNVATANANALLVAARQLRETLTCHLSYESPLGCAVPLPFAGPYRDTLTWLATELPAVDPTSVSARGTFTTETFRWNSLYERYEIVLDDLQLEDVGLLTSDA